MQAYVLDTNFNTIDLIDTFISFIWTDRYYGYGEFELILPAQYSHIISIRDGRYLYRKESEHLMIIETMEVITDVESGNILSVSGRSAESILDRRVIWESTKLTGSLQDSIFRLLNSNIIEPAITDRAISFFKYKRSNDPYILEQTIDLELHGENLYEVISMICQEREIGFKITLENNTYLLFELYHGEDRSYQQEKNPWIVFSPQFENLIHTDYIESSASLKTATLVFGTINEINDETGDEENVEIYRNIVSTEYPFKGINRREIMVSTSSNYENIDKSSLGEATDRVNIRDYQEYTYVYFDSQGWEKWKEEHPHSNLLTADDFKEYAWMFPSSKEEDAYEEAVRKAQKEIDDEYAKLVSDRNQAVENDMRQAALNEMSKYRIDQIFDGELQTLRQYILNRDFYIGDVVQVANEYGLQGLARVTEIVYSHDVNGDLMYPTFVTG